MKEKWSDVVELVREQYVFIGHCQKNKVRVKEGGRTMRGCNDEKQGWNEGGREIRKGGISEGQGVREEEEQSGERDGRIEEGI